MGGLLIAEAALDPSLVARRIIGLLAFDTPYLGMHPHVVVSGIASLLPKKEAPGSPSVTAQGMQTESEVNTSAVNIVEAHDAFPLGGGPNQTFLPTKSINPVQVPPAVQRQSLRLNSVLKVDQGRQHRLRLYPRIAPQRATLLHTNQLVRPRPSCHQLHTPRLAPQSFPLCR